MPDSQSAGQIIFFDLLLAGFIFFYSTTSSIISNELQLAMQTLTKPFELLSQPVIGSCTPLDVFCNASKDIVTATAYLAWAILNIPLLIAQVLIKIGAGLTLIYRLFFLTGNDFGIPYLGFILLGFQISLAFYGFSLLRGREP